MLSKFILSIMCINSNVDLEMKLQAGVYFQYIDERFQHGIARFNQPPP